MNIVSRLCSLAPACILFTVCTVSAVSAEAISVEIKENDTLSTIVANAYPGNVDRGAIMQSILERNPEAFVNGDINSLILGRQLVLPESNTVVSTTADNAVVNQAAVATQVEERDQLNEQLTQLEADNTALRANISRLETVGSEQSTQLEKLRQQAALTTVTETQQAGSTTVSPDVTQQLADTKEKLGQLQQESATLRADNAKTLAELEAVNTQLEASQAEVTNLRTELDAANEQLTANQADVTTLRSGLDAANDNNTALQSEIDQIKAAAETDVALTPQEPAKNPGSTWWPWLLALLLLPVAWLLGQRSRPAVQTAPAATSDIKIAETPAKPDPVVPEPLTSDQMAQMGFTGAEVITKPDDSDVAIKLDMARAYLDLRDTNAANDMLQEVIRDGGSLQQQEAKEILSFIA